MVFANLYFCNSQEQGNIFGVVLDLLITKCLMEEHYELLSIIHNLDFRIKMSVCLSSVHMSQKNKATH